MNLSWKNRAAAFWRNYARPFLFIFIVLTAFRSSIADWNDVPTGSMKPTILEGDRIFVNKLAYDLKVPYTTWHIAEWSGPSRGDIIIFFSPVEGTRLVKRVVGLPGDKVELRNEQLIINGQEASYEPLATDFVNQIPSAQRPDHRFAAEQLGGKAHPVMTTPDIRAMRNFGPITVPADQYFVMGDNRDNSADSRFIGPIPRSAIVGRACRVIASLDIGDYYLPRWGRFFKSLP